MMKVSKKSNVSIMRVTMMCSLMIYMGLFMTVTPSFAASNSDRTQAKKLGLAKTFVLVAKESGKCLAKAGGAKMGRQFHAWRCHKKSSNQPFKITRTDGPWFMVQSLRGRQCLDVSGGSKKDRKPVVQWACKGGVNQQWKIIKGSTRRSFKLKARHSGKCLTLSAADERISKFVQLRCDRNNVHQEFITQK